MLTRLQRCVVYPRQSKAAVLGTTNQFISLLQPLQTASISTKNRQVSNMRVLAMRSNVPMRAFNSDHKDVKIEAEAKVEALKESEPI